MRASASTLLRRLARPARGAVIAGGLFALLAEEPDEWSKEANAFDGTTTIAPKSTFTRTVDYTGEGSDRVGPFVGLRGLGVPGENFTVTVVRTSPASQTADAGYDLCRREAHIETPADAAPATPRSEMILKFVGYQCSPPSKTGTAVITIENLSDQPLSLSARGGGIVEGFGDEAPDNASITAQVISE